MKVENGNYLSINEVTDKYLGGSRKSSNNLNMKGMDAASFADILKGKEIEQEAAPVLRFSKHASQRLTDRNINLSSEQLSRLTEATGRASEKGINDSLVMVDNMAFIVNTGSRTVVTAMDAGDTKNNVFSNIDGAIFA